MSGHGHGHGHDDACCDGPAPAAHEPRHEEKKEPAKPARGGRRHFLSVVSKEVAAARWNEALAPRALEPEEVALADAHGRVLAEDVAARVDLPPFDRATVDGFAVLAADTFAASEGNPVVLLVEDPPIAAGDDGSRRAVAPGRAIEVATGAPLPRGANAVVMVENVETEGARARIGRAVVPGEGLQAAGSDVRRGEVLYRRGDRLAARDTGVLAGQGVASVACVRRPRVAVISTGDELVAPGGALGPGQIFDSNARLVADLVRENGCVPEVLGIAADDAADLRAKLEAARAFDAVVLSGGTSKGEGDLTYRLVESFDTPGVLVHGVAVKPGKPLVLAAWGRKPVAILPGFPTSAAITFDVFIRPVLRVLAGLGPSEPRAERDAVLAVATPSAEGRHEFVLANLVPDPKGGDPIAYPILKGSGSVTALAQADGWFEVAASKDRVPSGSRVRVTLLSATRNTADLVVLGSGCPALDRLLSVLRERHGFRAKVVNVGSRGGLDAAKRGEADVAPIQLLDAASGVWNERLAREAGVALVRGWARVQGLVASPATLQELGDGDAAARLARARALGKRLVRRNQGSGTAVLIDELLAAAAAKSGEDAAAFAAALPGKDTTVRSHEGAVAAVLSGKADLAVAIEPVAHGRGLAFVPLRDEELDLAIPRDRLERAPVRALRALLEGPELALVLAAPGYRALAGAGTLRVS